MKRVFVAGHNGMVGSSICRLLKRDDQYELITAKRSELDLCDQAEVAKFFKHYDFDEVYLAAARVGGIFANNEYPADFLYQNLMIQSNVIHSAFTAGVRKLLFLGSSCIYPRDCVQPIQESALLTGPLESTNEPYAIAKIAGIKMCESYNRQFGTDYRSVMPTNLYGPGDNYHPENSHVIPGLIRRFHFAKISKDETVCVWGSGAPRREFLFVDDLASACIAVMNADRKVIDQISLPNCSHVNVGYGEDITIKELAELIAATVGYHGKIVWDSQKPDGTPRKLMSSEKISKGIRWSPAIDLKHGLQLAYSNFCDEISNNGELRL